MHRDANEFAVGPLRATRVRSGRELRYCRLCRGEEFTEDGRVCPRCHGSGDADLTQRPEGDPS